MTPADILRTIETVSPADTDKLDEIDAAIAKYIFSEQIYLARLEYDAGGNLYPMPKFTRSRDELKKIRPDDFFPNVTEINNGVLLVYASKVNGIDSICLATEELAELHAIIQAIERERGGK